jgi:hypothetical protein
MTTTLYKKTRTGKIQQWSIWTKEKGDSGFPEVWVEFGQVDGKKQSTYNVIKEGMNIGRSNETTPIIQANLEMERNIKVQLEEGYKITVEETQTTQTVDFAQRFLKNLCFYKPKNSIDESKIEKLEKAKRLINTVKRDGMMHIVRKTEQFGVEIYSRRMDLVTDKYPHLSKALESLPNDTILLGEIILDINGKDNFNSVSRICRSDTEKALERQKEFGNVSYYIFDVAFLNGTNCLQDTTYDKRLNSIIFLTTKINNKYIKAVERINKPHDEALAEVKSRKLEGLVVWDADGIMKDGEGFTFNGKAYRPNVLWKSKPKYEDDFIVRFDPDNGIGDYGNGKNKNKIKNVQIYQLDHDGKEIDLGKCGGGLTDDQRDFYTDSKKFPRVWKIEYDSIQPNTGALRFPVFNDDRTLIGDKEIGECLMSDTIKQAREQEVEEDESE